MNDQLRILDHSGYRMKDGLKNNAKNGFMNMVEDRMKNKVEAGASKTTQKVIEIIQTHERGRN